MVGALLSSSSSLANCPDQIAEWELVKPAQVRLVDQLIATRVYPWGKLCPYGRLEGSTVYLTPEFETLTAQQKRQSLKLLRLTNWPRDLLTEDEKKSVEGRNGIMSPVIVVAADGRIVSIPYDGCTRYTLLTEYARSCYQAGLRQIKREIRFPLARRDQEAVKARFWKSTGKRTKSILCIEWVPESGHFEIDISQKDESAARKKVSLFLKLAPRQYKYVVLTEDPGSMVSGLN